MKFTRVLKRLLASRRRGNAAGRRRNTRMPRSDDLEFLDDLEFSVIPATDDYIYDQDVMPALLAQVLAAERSR